MADTQWQFNSHSDSQDIVSFVLDKAEATVGNFPLKRIARAFNAKMDLYFTWAFEKDGRWPYDDVNETTPPIDQQNIVSGTNRYKFGTFTEKVIRLIKLEALDADANAIELKPEYFNELGSEEGATGDSSKTFHELYGGGVDSGTPTHYCKYGDFVYLRPNPNYSETDGLIAYFNRPATYMASTDTTDVPGIEAVHIPLVAEMTANEWKYDKQKMSWNEKIAFENYVKRIVQKHFATRGEESRSIIKEKNKGKVFFR